MLTYSIAEQDGLYCGFLTSVSGLCAVTLPNEDKENIKFQLDSILRTKTKQILENIEEKPGNNHEVAKIIFSLHKTASDEVWKEALKIQIDYKFTTDNEKQVYETLRSIPRGEIVTYKNLAMRAGFTPTSARFIGNSMRKNPFPIIIPCHRVLKSDGGLGNYSGTGGIKQKKKYLQMEGALR